MEEGGQDRRDSFLQKKERNNIFKVDPIIAIQNDLIVWPSYNPTLRQVGEIWGDELSGGQPDPVEAFLEERLDGVDGIIFAGDPGDFPAGNLFLELGVVSAPAVGVSAAPVGLLPLLLLLLLLIAVPLLWRWGSSALTGVDLAQIVDGKDGVVLPGLPWNIASENKSAI